MNKKEQALKKAIKANDVDGAIECLAAFADLDSTSEEVANNYFEQIQNIGAEEEAVEVKKSPVVEGGKAEPSEEVEVAEAPRVETRGLKAKPANRQKLEKKFSELYELAIDYAASVKKDGDANSKFGRRFLKALHIMRKTILR